MKRYVSFVLMFALFAFHACEDNKNEEKFVIEFSPVEEHDFGTVEVNESASTKVRIKNSDESSGPFTGTIEIEDSPAFFSSFTGIIELQKNYRYNIPKYYYLHCNICHKFLCDLIVLPNC